MSDFFNAGWSLYVAIATIAGLLFCLLLLIIAAKRKVMAGDNTTGHVWDDDLRELNNPLPRWWMGLFVITVIFAFAYLFFYPGLGSAPGTLNWSSTGQLKAEEHKVLETTAPLYARFAGMPADKLAQDGQAMAIGERLFVNNCAQCHGSDARGGKGFPNLTDNDWLHGGTPEKIEETIREGRRGTMPPMAAAVGSDTDVHNVANYVLSLSGSPHNAIAAAAGKAKFAACAACHGADGKGNQAIGAPNLTDKIWLHGWGEEAIVSIVTTGKTNVMPAQGGRLSP
ncbi:MAG TPA: cytochrome-c oxidase, cbb3-type subunit III, partial [Burkholderiaceae bacterium]|nr:cytochrome-c oxidase, cbb3-type subunit III [Burkholderiaceae bacterium]